MPIRSSPPIRSLATANETLRRLVDPPPLIMANTPHLAACETGRRELGAETV